MKAVLRALSTVVILLLAAMPAVSFALACVIDGRAQPPLPAEDCAFMDMHVPASGGAAEHGSPDGVQHQEDAQCCITLVLNPPPAAVSSLEKASASWQPAEEHEVTIQLTAAPAVAAAATPPSRFSMSTANVRPAFAHAGARTYLATARLRL
jgi:hypothetical protein